MLACLAAASAFSAPTASPSRCSVPTLSAVAADAPIPSALEEALGNERACEVWDRRPPGPLPNEKKQAALIDWLSTSPLAADPERYLYPCLRREPKLLLKASSLRQLREAHAELGALLKEEESPGRFARAVAHEPSLLLASPEELREAAAKLGEVINLNSAQLARLLRQEPGVLLLSADSIEARLLWLRPRLGIESGGRLQRVLSRAPLLLLASTTTFESRLAVLIGELGVKEEAVGALVVRTPKLLHMPLASIRERAEWLESTGVVPHGGSDVGAFLARQPDYFSISAQSCKEAMRWLSEEVGLGEKRAAVVVATEPQLLSQPLDQLQLRVSFFLQVIGGSLDDLVQVPHMLTCDLAKVPMLRHAYCLSYGLSVPPVKLLTKGDVTFCEEVEGCDLESLNEFEREGKHLSFFQGAQV